MRIGVILVNARVIGMKGVQKNIAVAILHRSNLRHKVCTSQNRLKETTPAVPNGGNSKAKCRSSIGSGARYGRGRYRVASCCSVSQKTKKYECGGGIVLFIVLCAGVQNRGHEGMS